jgi:nuclease A inhibitor-like protein
MNRTSRTRSKKNKKKEKKASTRARVARTAAAGPIVAAKLARALHALARDLPNPADESTDFFHPFVAPMPPDTKLDGDAFHHALAIGGRYTVDLSSADQLFSGATDADNWGEEIALGFRQLERVMRATLSEPSVAFARARGVVRVRMWLFGRTEDGSLVGLRSTSTET